MGILFVAIIIVLIVLYFLLMSAGDNTDVTRIQYTSSYKPSGSGDYSRYSTYEESYLHSLGYRVGKTGLSQRERQNLLRQVIQKGQMSKRDVIYNLERNISMFQYKSNMQWSVSDWEEDLYFVKHYL